MPILIDKWLIDSEKDGVGYRVTISKEKVGEENVLPLLVPFSEREVFSITPVIAGAGRGGGMISGAALTGIAIVSGGAGLFAGGSLGFGATVTTTVAGVTTSVGFAGATFGAKFAIVAGNLGIALVLGGIAQALSPQPQLNSTLDESVQLESFTFSNVLNTSKQGMPVPIAYGRLFVGSAVLSSGLDVDQVQA